MDRWITYIRERFPQILWASIIGGIAISGNHLNDRSFEALPFILVFIGVWLFLFLLRLMNDYRDIDKDKIANPDFPLPRGVLDLKEVYKIILVLQILLFAYSELLWIALQGTVSLAYLILAVYAWLFFKDFWIPKVLERYPFVRTFAYNIFAFPLAFFAVAASQPHRIYSTKAWGFALVLFSAFTVYDLCRKLNPKAHPILSTPVHFYGYKNTFSVLFILLIVGAVGAGMMSKSILLWPLQIAVLATLVAVFFEREAYRAAEFASTISLLIHCWAGVF